MSPFERQPAEGKARAAVFGSTGFTGELAAKLINNHPEIELSGTAGRDAAALLDDPRMESVDVAVVAYPHGEAAELVSELRSRDVPVVDLSADFRLWDLSEYEHWYGEHMAPRLLGTAVYGLPEQYRGRISQAELVANPGCYPTASLLALKPLAQEELMDDVRIDAYSGRSGSGREGAAGYRAMGQRTVPYGQAGHRHQPEIEQELRAMGFYEGIKFRPHVETGVFQGLLATCDVELSQEVTQAELDDLYRSVYYDEPFVRIAEEQPAIDSTEGTNFCEIQVSLSADRERAIVNAAIDNLWKGAAGQAVQNINLMRGLEEETGLF